MLIMFIPYICMLLAAKQKCMKRKVNMCAYMFTRWINIMHELYLLERKGTTHSRTNKRKNNLFTV